MKATFSIEKKEITLDSEAIKAIRFVNGYDSDLRIKLNGREASEKFWYFLDKNIFDILGADAGAMCISPEKESWEDYEHMVADAVRQICGQ